MSISPRRERQILAIAAILLFLLGSAVRIWSFIGTNQLYWLFMTEDGYLMHTVARNIAIGNGITVSNGTIATNGVQPLATFLYALGYFPFFGDKYWGVVASQIMSFFISLGAAFAVYRLALIVMFERENRRELSAVAAGLWFSNITVLRHTMNGLETGLYLLFSMLAVLYYLYLRANSHSSLTWGSRVRLGVLLGLTFLARIDAVFLIASILLLELVQSLRYSSYGWDQRLFNVFIPGVISIMVAAPWIIYCYASFGSIMPISGRAQSLSATFGGNLLGVPAKLLEYSMVVVPVPGAIETSAPVVALGVIGVLLLLVVYYFTVARHQNNAAKYFWIGLLFSACLVIYYGCFFGAAHFLGRYLAPVSGFFAIVTLTSIIEIVHRAWPALKAGLTVSLVCFLSALSGSLSLYYAYRGPVLMHKQVVDWVLKNVPTSTWVGAIQSGTLGYFHDRTINLDGKVNADALESVIRNGDVLQYVIDSEIVYLVDWVGIAGWADSRHPAFAHKFEIVIEDPKANIAVLRRRDSM